MGAKLVTGVLASLSLGCGRKAPGPAECVAFAHKALGVEDERLQSLSVVQQMVDEVVKDCLTTPYDRKLTQCVAALPSESALRGNRLSLNISRGAQICLAEFKLRRQASDQVPRRSP